FYSTPQHVSIHPLSLHDALPISPVGKLKKNLYAPDKGTGTWLTMTVSVHESMKYSVDYEYDSEPDPRFAVSAQAYLQELERFPRDRKSTRLNSSHVSISYAVFCL